MKKNLKLSGYLKQNNKELIALRILQEIVVLFILHYVIQLYGNSIWSMETLLLIALSSICYFILWAIFFKRNRNNIYIFYICGYNRKDIYKILFTIMISEVAKGCLLGNIWYLFCHFIFKIEIISVKNIVMNSILLIGLYMIGISLLEYIVVSQYIATIGGENERNIFHNI